MKKIIIIDTDIEFHNRLKKRFDYSKLSNDYSLDNVSPDTSLPEYEIIDATIRKFNDKYKQIINEIAAVFVDIVVIENGSSFDSTGIDIASHLKLLYPSTPIFNITSKVASEEQWNIISDATLSNVDGVFIKTYLEGKTFNKARLEKILTTNKTDISKHKFNSSPPNKIDIAIITALHDNEFENVKDIFDLKHTIEDKKNIYHLGQIKSEHDQIINVIAASQHRTGVVDAAILATEIITNYNPDYLIMTGVCGGNPLETKLGDMIFAESLILYQKGKEDEGGFHKEIEYTEIDSKLIQKVRNNKTILTRKVIDTDKSRNNTSLNLHIEKMACGLSVINKEGFFEEVILEMDRKTIGLDMESYSIARACKIANDGNTKAIIIKSVMDKTAMKNDANKAYASYTSALLAKAIIELLLY